ncbi:hypothetical protein MXB_4154 [Myxobolus squamalis]|nr:hypothetical protein MXB_4154 [Myxobolus squamalis]
MSVKEDESLFLFITTLESVSYIHIQKSLDVSIIDSIGCNPKCCTIFENKSMLEFYVATESALNCYTSAGRTKCIPIPGEKGFLKSFKNNLVFTLKSAKLAGFSANFINASIKGVPLSKMDSLQILTIDDKVKYLSNILCPSTGFIRDVPDVIDIAYIWGSVYVFLASGQIICKFGDYLYTKGDLEQAMIQYVQTIETIEPSYVIKKFLDAQNIHHLTTYLESLHKSSLANSDHTTLLLNCYIRLKETDKLDEFLRADRLWHFDPETALRVCHQAGFIEQALVLARKTNQHNYRMALEYLKKLKITDAELVLKNYGRRLLKDTPKELVEFLKCICTCSPCITNPNPCLPEDFIHIFIQQRSYLRVFLEYIISVNSACSNQIYNTLIELYVYEIAECKNPAEKITLESKCLNIISFEEDKYDTDHALMLCQLNNFIKGLVAIYIKTNKFSMILQHHMESKDYENIVSDCIKYGSFEPQLWKTSLEYLTQNYDECQEYLKEVLSCFFVIPTIKW